MIEHNQPVARRPALRNRAMRVNRAPRYVRKMKMMNNQDLLKNLVPLWHATRAWAEELLRRHLELENAADVLKTENRGRKAIKGTNWIYRTHGVGVDIYKTEESGGIDFDFDKPEPDTWRMKTFFKRQYNEGNLNFETYRHLFEDEELLDRELTELLEPRT